jgi:hypothetical protein
VSNNYAELPWNFEAFRRFLTFEVIQNAAGVIALFDGTDITDEKKLMAFQRMLNERTGMTWEPARQNSEDVLYSSEGSVFRNKARVLSSIYILNPFELKRGVIQATDFTHMLASGVMSEESFYDFIVQRYKYPHPAYDDNWAQWTAIGIEIKPFIFILQILYALYRRDSLQGYLTVNEFARFAHSNPDHNQVEDITSRILEYRENPSGYDSRTRSDKIDRKINDVFGFMCMTKYVYYHGSNIVLNLVRKHTDENVYFYGTRKGAKSVLDEIEETIEKGLS